MLFLDSGSDALATVAATLGALLGVAARELLNKLLGRGNGSSSRNGNAGSQSKEFWMLEIGKIVEKKLEPIQEAVNETNERLENIENTMERRSIPRD